MKIIAPEALDLAQFIVPGSNVVIGHSTAEPAALLEALVAQREKFSGTSLLMHAAFSTILKVEHADHLRFEGLGALGTQARLAKAGVLDIIPTHLSDFVRSIRNGMRAIDVALVSVSAPDAEGRYSLGLVNDYSAEAALKAGVVIAQMNRRMPFTFGGPYLTAADIDILVPADRELLELQPGKIGDVERAIAANIARYIDDGAVLQFGVGAVPDALAAFLDSFRDLGIHSGVIPDAARGLIERGIVTNARKPIDAGISVTGAIWGTRALYDFVDKNPAVAVRSLAYTHVPETLARLTGLVSVNSAIEIDLSGQANLETVGGRYIGAIGGGVDFVRGARIAERSRSILALPSTARNGSASRIVPRLGGTVTIARSDVDTVITEYGCAELRNQTLTERAKRLIAIAHPDFREALERDFSLNRSS